MAEELLREEIDEILIKLKANELLLIATDLQIVLKEDEKDNKRKLLRLVEQYIDDLENIETLKQAKESFAKYIPINKNDTSNEHADGETDKGDTSKEQNNDETKTNDAKNNASKEPCNKDGRKDGEKNNASVNTSAYNHVTWTGAKQLKTKSNLRKFLSTQDLQAGGKFCFCCFILILNLLKSILFLRGSN